MSRQTIDAGSNPEVIVTKVHGDLQVRGWDAPQIVLQADPEDLTLEHDQERVQLACRGDLSLHLPNDARLTVEESNGDASFKFLEGALVIGRARGSLDLRQVAACQIGEVHGDFRARGVSGGLQVERVHGDADMRQVDGDCNLDSVDGNLDLQMITGAILVQTRGDARLRLRELNGESYRIEANGSIYCYLPEDADLRIRMSSDGELIKIRLPQGSNAYQQPEYELVLGQGTIDMDLSASGSVYLFVEQPGWPEPGPGGSEFGLPEDFGQQIAQQVEAQLQAQMSDVTRRINEQMERLSERLGRAGFSSEETERIVEQARRTGERESTRAQEKMRRAQEKLERKLETHQRRAEARREVGDRRTRRSTWGFEWSAPPAPPIPPQPPSPAATEQERLIILRMLEQKKISLEEADQLLSALEGIEPNE